MKKIALILCVILVFTALTGCTTSSRREMTPPATSELPNGFEMIQSAGNGYFLYSSPIGYFLVSKQVQGEFKIFSSNRFIDIIYIGKELSQ